MAEANDPRVDGLNVDTEIRRSERRITHPALDAG